MVTKEQKKEIVAGLSEKFKKASGYYIVNFDKMTVGASIQFRRELRKNGFEMKVAKNTLIERALQAANLNAIPEKNMFGPSGIIFSYDDPIAPAKIIKERFEKFEKPALKAAVIENVFYDGSQLKTLASLPSKPELIAGILGSLDAPITGIVGAINAVMRDLAYLVEEVAKTKEEPALN
jgi:large subunit ribosomal protein L10